VIATIAGFGPAFVAAIAYVDPGNVAANVSAGAQERYALVWVLVAANLMAAVVQYASARLGLVTGRTLPELIGSRLSRPARLAFWAQAEVVAAATDVAEVVGGALALQLLVGLPLVLGGVVVGAVSLLLLALQSRRGARAFEGVMLALLGTLAIGFAAGLLPRGVDWPRFGAGLVPRFDGGDSVLLAASMLGATVMPHVVYLHSALVRDRHGRTEPHAVRRLLRITRIDVGLALLLAGSVNVALLVLAAQLGDAGTASIEQAHDAIAAAAGPTLGVVFAIGLLASGLASSSVGAYAGAVIMAGLLRVRIPLLARRAATLLPALVLLALGAPPTATLVLTQVVLSLGLPFALVPLVRLNSDAALMGPHVARRALRTAAWIVTALVVALNVLLLALTFSGTVA
jgi:manganese transport protein